MKISDIIKNIDKSSKNECYIKLEDMCQSFEIESVYADTPRITAYWATYWYCTDTWVGTKLYFFDGQPVAISHQPSRKANETFRWFSEQDAMNVKLYILSFIDPPVDIFEICDFEEDFPDTYELDFEEQILFGHHKAIWNNIKVKPIFQGRSTDIGNQIVKIEFDCGMYKEVPISELKFFPNVAS